MSVDTLAASSPFLIEEAVEFKEARSYVESIRNPYLRDYANRYLWHILSFAKKPSDRGLPETEARQVERKIAEFIPLTIPQYSTTVNPFKKKELKPKAKYVLVKGTGSIVSVESWEREKAGMIARGETVPEVEYIEEKPSKYEPATVEGEPVPEKYRELTPLIDLPLPPGADFLAAVIPEERKIDVVMKQLKDGVESIQDSTQFRLFLTTMAKFHDYSIGNQILIMLQKPEASRVGGFVTWKDLGRWVKKGERGIAILAPVMPPKPRKEEDEEEEIVPLTPVYFKVVHVFDISQTEGKSLPEFEVPVLTGEANEELFNKALAMAKNQGLDVSFESRPRMDPSIKGMYSAPKSIWVRPEESRAQQLKSLLHEVAHYYSEGVFRIPRRDAETIAESSAFAVGAHYGFDSGVRSFPYVALWAQDKKVLSQNLNTIRKVADTMLHALEGTPKQSVEMLAQVSDEPSAILKVVWGHLKCRKPKPSISLRRQHSTAVYWTDEHKITIREDSWRKMHPGEKKLIVVHEALHACGAGHQPGFRTATDTMAELIYKRIWGEDEDWRSFIAELERRLTRFLRQPSLLPNDELLLAVEYLAETEGDPISKFCCRFSDACAPLELLGEGKFPERIAWLRQHYKEKHPGFWGKMSPMTSAEAGEVKEYRIEKNEPYGTWAVIELWLGGTVRSPFKTKEEAIEMEEDVGRYYGWKLRRVEKQEPEEKLSPLAVPEGTPVTPEVTPEGKLSSKYGLWDSYTDYGAAISEAGRLRKLGWQVRITEAQTPTGKKFRVWTTTKRRKIEGHLPYEPIPRAEAVTPTAPAVEYFPDSAEFVAETIMATGYREKLDEAFQEAIARVKHDTSG